MPKAEALAFNLKKLRTDLTIETHDININTILEPGQNCFSDVTWFLIAQHLMRYKQSLNLRVGIICEGKPQLFR